MLKMKCELSGTPKKVLKICSSCGRRTSYRCSSCLSIYYCSKYCQSSHWSLHKSVCRKVSIPSKIESSKTLAAKSLFTTALPRKIPENRKMSNEERYVNDVELAIKNSLITSKKKEYQSKNTSNEIKKENIITQEKLENNLLKRIADLENDRLCSICFENPKTIVFIPCRHLCSCEVCSKRIGKKCPVCRENIYEKIRVFNS